VVMTPRSHSESLSPSDGLFTLPLMIGMRSAFVSKKKLLELTPWRLSLDPVKHIAQYLRRERNLES
jgi:hypothetical protein